MNRSNFNSKYTQGVFKPQHPEKYIGDLSNAKFRSSWEYSMCIYLDLSDQIVRWGIEQPVIVYYDLNNQAHRYYPDFVYEILKPGTDANYLERVIVEIKPQKELYPPERPKNETKKALENYEYAVRQHIKNKLKWSYAEDFAEKNHYKFIIVTEETLKKKGILKS